MFSHNVRAKIAKSFLSLFFPLGGLSETFPLGLHLLLCYFITFSLQILEQVSFMWWMVNGRRCVRFNSLFIYIALLQYVIFLGTICMFILKFVQSNFYMGLLICITCRARKANQNVNFFKVLPLLWLIFVNYLAKKVMMICLYMALDMVNSGYLQCQKSHLQEFFKVALEQSRKRLGIILGF